MDPLSTIKDVVRMDNYSLKNPVITPDGYLKCEAVVVARAGTIDYEVMPDGKPGVRTDFIAADELGNDKSIETLKMLPIVNGHPKDLPKGFIDSTTAKAKAIGHIGENIHLDGNNLVSSIIITDAKAIEDYKNGKRGLSLAYLTDLVPTTGVFQGKQYQFIQTNRRYNHLALCDQGRAGDVARIPDLANHDGVEIDHSADPQPIQRSYVMLVTINVDGIDYKDQAPEVARHLDTLRKQVAALTDEKTKLAANLDAMTGERDAAKTKIGTLEKEITELPGKISQGVKERADLVSVVTPHLDAETVAKIGTLSDADLRKAITAKAFPELKEKIATANEAYLMPVFDSAIVALKTSNVDAKNAAARVAANGGADPTVNTDAAPKTEEQARKEMIERTKGLYQGKK
jgi:hypothetical protein